MEAGEDGCDRHHEEYSSYEASFGSNPSRSTSRPSSGKFPNGNSNGNSGSNSNPNSRPNSGRFSPGTESGPYSGGFSPVSVPIGLTSGGSGSGSGSGKFSSINSGSSGSSGTGSRSNSTKNGSSNGSPQPTQDKKDNSTGDLFDFGLPFDGLLGTQGGYENEDEDEDEDDNEILISSMKGNGAGGGGGVNGEEISEDTKTKTEHLKSEAELFKVVPKRTSVTEDPSTAATVAGTGVAHAGTSIGASDNTSGIVTTGMIGNANANTNTNSNTNTNTNTNTTGGGSDIGTVLCAQGKKAIGQAEALAAERSNWIDVRTGILADRADGERSRLARSMQVSL